MELLARVKQLDFDGTIGSVSNVTYTNVVLTNITAKIQDLRRHLSQVEDRIHMANSMNNANRRLIRLIEVLYFVCACVDICSDEMLLFSYVKHITDNWFIV